SIIPKMLFPARPDTVFPTDTQLNMPPKRKEGYQGVPRRGCDLRGPRYKGYGTPLSTYSAYPTIGARKDKYRERWLPVLKAGVVSRNERPPSRATPGR